MATATRSVRQRFQDLAIDKLLTVYIGLRLLPVVDGNVRIAGPLTFTASAKGYKELTDTFVISISIPEEFPDELPVVRETGGRVPRTFHTYSDGSLCLGSPTSQRLHLAKRPTALAFIQRCLIPYFYNFLYFQLYDILPFGELAHGWKGIDQDLSALFGVKTASAAVEMIRLTSLKKRTANKIPCPCGSGRRLGNCHNLTVNNYRDRYGRSWFRREYFSIMKLNPTRGQRSNHGEHS